MNFIATQVLNKTSGLLCVTYYTDVNATVANSLCCRMICGECQRIEENDVCPCACVSVRRLTQRERGFRLQSE